MERKRITIPSLEDRALKAIANNENGADYGVLQVLAGLVLGGREIDPDFQKVANAIVVQSLLFDTLPPKRKGRPKNEDGDGFSVALMYYDLLDSGVRYADAVAQVAGEFHKDERHIMRIVKENRHLIGNSKEERQKKRDWWRICAEVRESVIAKGGTPADEQMLKVFEEADARDRKRDLVGELDEIIEAVVNRRFPTDTK